MHASKIKAIKKFRDNSTSVCFSWDVGKNKEKTEITQATLLLNVQSFFFISVIFLFFSFAYSLLSMQQQKCNFLMNEKEWTAEK